DFRGGNRVFTLSLEHPGVIVNGRPQSELTHHRPAGEAPAATSSPRGSTTMTPQTRREFLADVGKGMLVAIVGAGHATDRGMGSAFAADKTEALQFGKLESLVCLMQETAPEKLLPLLVARLQKGTDLKEIVSAAALANARNFGGEDYVGFHTMMALAPAYHM